MNVLATIGNTPLVEIHPGLYAKLEYFNPTGSIKDRIAKQIIEDAEKEGKLKPGMTIVEATSGNTGIALAFLGLVKGYKVKILMPAYMSEERKQLLRLLNADLELCDDAMTCIRKAREYSKKEGYFFANQFANLSNVKAHLQTGKEIWEQTKGRITHFFAGIGTGGTITGVAKFLKAKKPSVKIIGIMPKDEDVIQGLMNVRKSKEYAGVLDKRVVDEIIEIGRKEAIEYQKKLIKKGILAGESSGAVYKVALEFQPSCGVFIVADGVFKYLSVLSSL